MWLPALTVARPLARGVRRGPRATGKVRGPVDGTWECLGRALYAGLPTRAAWLQKNEEPGGEPGSSTMHFSRELLLVPVVPAVQRPLARLGRESLGSQFLEQLYAVVLARLMHVW